MKMSIADSAHVLVMGTAGETPHVALWVVLDEKGKQIDHVCEVDTDPENGYVIAYNFAARDETLPKQTYIKGKFYLVLADIGPAGPEYLKKLPAAVRDEASRLQRRSSHG